MTIFSVDEMWSNASSDVAVTDKFRKFDANFTRAYQVLHSPNVPDLEIYQAQGIPAAGSPFPGFPYCFAERAQLRRVSPIYTIATVNYSGEIGVSGSNGGQSGGNTSPIFNPPRIDWDDVETEEECDEDFDGNAIVTANYEPITGVKRPIPDQTVTIRRNMPTFNSYVQSRYRQSVNSDSFLGWPPGTARLTKYAASNVYDQNLGYWEVTAVIQFRYPYRTTPDKAWHKRVRHEGFYERIDLTGPGLTYAIVRAQDKLGEPVTKPVLLDANGYRIPDGDPAYWLEFKIFDSLPFNALGLI